jgi:hypothetical protein
MSTREKKKQNIFFLTCYLDRDYNYDNSFTININFECFLLNTPQSLYAHLCMVNHIVQIEATTTTT